MAKAIHFPCPACGGTLRLPLEMAAAHGPCPLCHTAIIAPDPARNLAARLPEPPAPPESPAIPVQPPPPAGKPTRPAIHILFFLLTALVSLVVGYLIGTRSAIPSPTNVTAPAPPPTNPIVPEVPEPKPKPEPAPPVGESEPAPEPAPAPVKASAAAEAALKAFLNAPDWAARAAHTLSSASLLAEMEAYSHTVPDGPTPFESISLQNSYTDKTTGDTLFIYQLVTPDHPQGFPVAVSETADGWRVDWKAFVEFRDDHFAKFADGPAGESRRFHLIVSTPPEARADATRNEHFSSFLIAPPLPDRQRLAYVRKASALHATLRSATAEGTLFAPVLEVAKRSTPDNKTYLEITAIPATDWLPTPP